MTVKQVNHKYLPRSAFMRFHQSGARFSVLVCHRRAGKTYAVVNHMVVRALRTQKQNAFYAYVAPYFGQAKQTAWAYIKAAVRDIPGTKVSESETSVTLPNGAKLRVFGADNSDALRGLYFDGIVCDEFGDWEGRAYTEVIRPALADRKGWAVFIGTPRGKNKFFEMREKARKDDSSWFYMELKASESGILPESELEASREDMDEDEYAQEYECSFDATIRGSYWGKHVRALEERGAMRDVPLDMEEPVTAVFDIGYADATAIWFYQVINGELRVIDYFEETGYDAEETVEVLDLKPYRYEAWWLPHDALAKTFRSKKSVVETIRDFGATVRIVPRLDVKDGIDAARKTLRTYPIVFDQTKCARGIEAIKNYSRKWDADRKVFSDKATHDEWSHGADAFRYLSLVVNHEAIQRSVDKARAKAVAKARGQVNSPNSLAQNFTMDEAWAARDRLMRSVAQTRARI